MEKYLEERKAKKTKVRKKGLKRGKRKKQGIKVRDRRREKEENE